MQQEKLEEAAREYRVGRKQKRAVLNSRGILIVLFPVGHEVFSQMYCDFLNSDTIQDYEATCIAYKAALNKIRALEEELQDMKY